MLAPALLEKRLKAELAALQKANKACFNCSALVRLHSEWYCREYICSVQCICDVLFLLLGCCVAVALRRQHSFQLPAQHDVRPEVYLARVAPGWYKNAAHGRGIS